MKRALLLIALAGCPDPTPDDIELFGTTGAPPAGRAVIVNNEKTADYSVNLSAGVAMAARCWSTCTNPCVATVTAEHPDVLDVRPVYRVNGAKGEYALIAKRPGATTLFVDDGCVSRAYVVKIAAP